MIDGTRSLGPSASLAGQRSSVSFVSDYLISSFHRRPHSGLHNANVRCVRSKPPHSLRLRGDRADMRRP